MESLELFEAQVWNPLAFWGIHTPWAFINKDTIIYTWAVLAVILVLSIGARFFLHKYRSVIHFIVKSSLRVCLSFVHTNVGSTYVPHALFIFFIFSFILLCNWIALLPGLEEPTRDLNTTLALGCVSFFYKEYYMIKTHGIQAYISEFLQPFFIMLPLNIIGHFSKIISISFRLFGNIFGGSVIMGLYSHALSGSLLAHLLSIISGVNLIMMLFFVIFEGLIQAFVFTILTATYLGLVLHQQPAHEPGVI